MKKWNCVSKKGQDKSPETDLNEMEISVLSDSEFKITVITMLSKIRRTIMYEVKISAKRKYSKVLNRHHGAEEK